jgi:hypothetical protein
MTREHDALRDLLAPVALGAADAVETARVEAHAAECAVCREELASLRAGADVLAVAVTQHDPSPQLKTSLMATVRAEAAERQAAEAGAPVPPRRRGIGERIRSLLPSGVRPWTVVAAAATIAALLLGWNIALQTTSDSRDDEVAAVSVQGTADAPGVTARIVYMPDEETAVVRLAGLPKLDPGDAYQLWVLRDGAAESAGLFQPTGPAEAVRVAEDLGGADALAVTAQPRTNLTTPQGPILVQANLTG